MAQAKPDLSEPSHAARAAWRYGQKLGLITVPLKILGSGKDKRVIPFVPYTHLNGQGFSRAVFEELWADHLDAPGLGIYSEDLREIEADSPKGAQALRELKLPRTPKFRSRRGPKYLFKAPTGEILVNKAADGLLGPDTEVLKKLLIVPPTPGYTWIKGRSLLDVPFAPMPERVVARLRPKRPSPKPSGKVTQRIPEHQRHNALLSMAGAMRRKGAEEPEILAALLEMNKKRCVPPLPEREVEVLARDIDGRYAPAEEAEHRTDTGNARRLVRLHRGRILFCPDHKAWYIWNGSIWAKDVTLEIEQLAKATVRQMLEEAAQIEDKEKREALVKWSIASESQPRLDAMVKNARSEVAVTPQQLNADPYLLSVENGTINLRTGKLRPHDPADLITLLAPVEYRRDAKDDRWEEVLDRFVRPDEGKEAFLQRSGFASLTGSISDKAFINLYDNLDGNTGKTTFIESLLAVLGPYGATVNAESFLTNYRGGSSIRSDLAACDGKRMVVSSEIPPGRHLDVELMKKLTAGEGKYRFERKHENSYENTVTFTIWLDGNTVAKARVEDNPLFDRWRLTPFLHVIKKPDRKWLSKAVNSPRYRAAVLAWVMQGRKAWLKGGAGSAPIIEEATAKERWAMDPLADFWEEEVQFGPIYFTPSADLRQALAIWTARQGHGRVINDRDLGQLLRARGAESFTRRIGGRVVRGWKGLKLRNG